MPRLVSLSLAVLATPAAVLAQPAAAPAAPAPSHMLQQRAEELLAILNGGGEAGKSFAPQFLAQIPERQIRELSGRLIAQLGPAKAVTSLSPTGPSQAALLVAFENGVAEMELVIAPGQSGQIIGWRVTGTESAAVARLRTLDDVAAAFRQLPGRTGFAVADFEVGDRRGETLAAALAPDDPLAVGSTFKLVILAELIRAVDAGERRWGDLIPIDGAELPAGLFRDLPTGSRIPLRGLAEAMIKVSDNSATDMLIRLLGREKIEAMQSRVGWRAGDANKPFLTTLEAFKLKGVGQGELGRDYLARDVAGRRAMLANEVAKMPENAIGSLFADDVPVMIDKVEWFASPADLVRVMRWIADRQHTRGGVEALRILAINPGPAAQVADRFAYVGYKGGSEPGVISMTLLLRAGTGKWRVVSGSWNNGGEAVDELRFTSLVRRAAELSAGALDTP